VMREESLLCQLKRRFVPTTDSGHAWRTYPNLLPGTTLTAPDQAWVAENSLFANDKNASARPVGWWE
jgi:putative transposase